MLVCTLYVGADVNFGEATEKQNGIKQVEDEKTERSQHYRVTR